MTNLSNNALRSPGVDTAYVAAFENLRMTDVESVGGKNASLGEMISQLAGAGVSVPTGFATTAKAFRDFLDHAVDGGASLGDRIATRLEGLDIDDVRSLAADRLHIGHAQVFKCRHVGGIHAGGAQSFIRRVGHGSAFT